MTSQRNPPWKRDELILALDLYMDVRGTPKNSDKRVIELSDILRKLPIHSEEIRKENFRNENSVAMKCGNFQDLDPDAHSGLPAGSKLDAKIWKEFHNKRDDLKILASNIKKLTRANQSILNDIEKINPTDEIGDVEVKEGESFYRLHKYKERNSSIVRRKKEMNKETLVCEVCSFNFVKKYGDLGVGFIECHHTKPIAELIVDDKTNIKDLALVCSNCHRMLHRKGLLSVEKLCAIINLHDKNTQHRLINNHI